MDHETVPFCGKHRMSREWRPTVYQYDADGVSIEVPNIHAWVCPADGEAYFAPETVDELSGTVRELIESAKHSRELIDAEE
jgi:YgiT-type zinc finger domain-containing protein